MYGICINCKKEPFVSLMLQKLKTVETRLPNKRTGKGSLDRFIGERVGLLETGTHKRAVLRGYATISERITYDRISFRNDTRHCISIGSDYDIPEGGFKYGYVLTDIEECDPIEINAPGRAYKCISNI